MSTDVEKFVEEKHREGWSLRFQIKEHLYSGQSQFQKVDVVETVRHGKMLLNDNLIMLSERDEFIYHEMITHLPLFVHPNPRKVLVIGGGDGGTAREVLRHTSVEKCHMVEIDAMVVEACKKFIPVTSCELDNPRLELTIDDGVKFVAETKEKFDVVIVDSTDPIGPAQPLFNESFYKNVDRVLAPDGIVVSQGESPFYEPHMQRVLLSILKKVFKKATIYNFSNLTYPGGLWSFTYASKGLDPLKDFNPERVAQSDLTFRYYNPDIHRGAFCLPQFMRLNLEGLI